MTPRLIMFSEEVEKEKNYKGQPPWDNATYLQRRGSIVADSREKDRKITTGIDHQDEISSRADFQRLTWAKLNLPFLPAIILNDIPPAQYS